MKISSILFVCTKTIRNLISKETEITTNHLTPEIKLHLITEKCRLFHEDPNVTDQPFKDPFFMFYWPGGQGMSKFILDNSEIVRNKRVLDFGSGCGASAIAAKLSHCSKSIANDISENALIAAEMNAELNNVTIETDSRNLINCNETIRNFDIVMFGDVFYDEEFAQQLLPWIRMLVKNDKLCLIGDPGRHALSRNLNLKKLATYQLPENICIENHGFSSTNVFEVKK
jgi:ETFB lysine methyltransferase